MYFNGYSTPLPGGPITLLVLGFVTTASSIALWFRDVVTEGTFLGDHTFLVQKGISIGVALFIVSEVFFFLSIFWSYFHSSLSPTVELGAQ
jgi:cytochrome c oxidase subunit 3